MKLFTCSHAEEWKTLETRLVKVENRLLGLELEQETFRNKVLRKIQFKKDDEQPETQDIYRGVLLKE